jgi:ATP-dependent DNA helicase DinG
MKIYLHELDEDQKMKKVEELLKQNKKTLVLFKSRQSMLKFKENLPLMSRLTVGFEGDRELTSIIKDFQNGTIKTLCSYHLWEGVDLPEESLTQIIIYELPFPPKDPLFEAKRKFAGNPFEEVDMPFMLLRLQQGIGRLIRTANDYGDIHILLNEEDRKMRSRFLEVLPVEPQ